MGLSKAAFHGRTDFCQEKTYIEDESRARRQREGQWQVGETKATGRASNTYVCRRRQKAQSGKKYRQTVAELQHATGRTGRQPEAEGGREGSLGVRIGVKPEGYR